jgi:hypothetical protein
VYLFKETQIVQVVSNHFPQFYQSMDKSVTNDISNSITRILRVLSDLAHELDTIRL